MLKNTTIAVLIKILDLWKFVYVLVLLQDRKLIIHNLRTKGKVMYSFF